MLVAVIANLMSGSCNLLYQLRKLLCKTAGHKKCGVYLRFVHTAEALPDIISTIQAKGYQCVKVSEVL